MTQFYVNGEKNIQRRFSKGLNYTNVSFFLFYRDSKGSKQLKRLTVESTSIIAKCKLSFMDIMMYHPKITLLKYYNSQQNPLS